MNLDRPSARLAARRILAGAAVSAIALVSTQAQAQFSYGLNAPSTTTSASPTGTTCPTGVTAGLVLSEDLTSGTQTDCASYDNTSTASYNDSDSFNYNGQANGYQYYDSASAETTFTTSEVTTTDYDFTTNPAGTTTNTAPPVPVGDASVTDVYLDSYGYTTVSELSSYGAYTNGPTVDGEAPAATYGNSVTASSTSQEYSYGTMTYDADDNELEYTPTSGGEHYADVDEDYYYTWDADGWQESTQSAAGFTATDSDGNTTTLSATGLSNASGSLTFQGDGSSHVTVNADDVVIHGGTTSTTVTVSNAGFNVTDDTSGLTTFNVADDGEGTLLGGLTIQGSNGTGLVVQAGGANITGGTTTDTLNVTGGATIGTTLAVGTNLTVSGTSTLTGTLAANGGITTTNVVASGNVTTATGRVQAGNVVINGSNGGKISGLTNATLSATSTEAVTGQQLFATNSAVTALTGRVDILQSNMRDLRNKAYQGVAMGFAMNAAPLNLANGEKGITAGVGVYQGEVAGAVKAQYVNDAGFGLGANLGFSQDAVGGGVGASMKF